MTDAEGVLIVADATSTRRRIGTMVADSAGFVVVAEADDISSALAQARVHRPAVVVLDLPMTPEEHGELAMRLAVIDAAIRIVVLGVESSLVDDLRSGGRFVPSLSSPALLLPKTAVVCDDDAMTRRLVGQILANLGIEVVADIDAIPHLLPVVSMTRPDLVVLDLWLEGTTGLSVLPELTSLTANPVVIAYSGLHEWEGRAQGAGAAAFVLKPHFDELEAAVRRLVPCAWPERLPLCPHA